MTNLQEVLNINSIRVPIIQRDYAQGREDKKVSEIRNTFLESIADRLIKKETLHLDFVYGSIKNDVFIPLDGQQRLTTLFLLYWYFGKKEEKNIEFLKKFTYETRASSREFCQKLIRNNFDFSHENFISNMKDSTWFLAFWQNDPTIKSMLCMIDAIHQKFYDNTFFDELDNITFEFFELEKFGLDDDLYIKMNARGKPLTKFENFKAKFEQFLEKKDSKLKQEFETKIDNDWTNFFWQYKDENYLIDNAFMNYFYYITEMLYYKKHISLNQLKVDDITFEVIEEIYQNIENIIFLFKSLDKLSNTINGFYKLFSQNNYEENKVALFDRDIKFLEQVINKGISEKGSIGIQKKFILFMVISFFIENDEVSNEFKDFIRVARNFTERLRNLKKASLQYTPNFEYRELNKILNLFLKYLNKDIYNELKQENTDWNAKEFRQEVEKAKLMEKNIGFKKIIFILEDYQYLKGDIHNFLDDDISKMELYSKSILEIFDNQNDTLIIRAMLTIGDCRLSKGGTRKVEERYFFGKNEYWEIFLTDSSISKKIFFQKFIEKYNFNNSNLQEMIDSYIVQNKDWKSYFIQYKEMLTEDIELSKDSNFFAWNNDFNIEKMGGLRIDAFHINPYIRVVALNTNKDYMYYRKEEESYLSIDSFIDTILSLDKNWTIQFSKKINDKIKNDLIEKYELREEKSKYILDVKNKDRIQLAIEFIKYIETWQSK